MSYKYNSLDELRLKKEILKKDVSEMEALLKFQNPKESLSALTDGFTDQFLAEKYDDNGNPKTVLNKNQIVKQLSTNMKNKIISKDTYLGIADTAINSGAMDDIIKLGMSTLVANTAKKKMKKSSWKQKILGLAIIYLAPIAIKFISRKLDGYQKKKSISSMEKLI